MKSTILSLLPLAGITLAAESVCGLKTVTVTEYAQPYETPKVVEAAAKPSSCSRSTVTTTTWEQVYVTVTADDYEEEAETTRTIDVTSTSTLHLTTTVTVHRSRSTPAATPAASSVAPAAPSVTPIVSSVKFPTAPYYPNTTTTHEVEYSLVYTPVPQSEAYQPSADAEKPADATAVPTSKYEAPAKSTPAPEPTKEETTPSAGSKKGDATFYGGNIAGGMCSFSGYTLPSGLFGTALSDSNWVGGDNCGVCVSVTGPSGNKIKAMIVDQCPGCGENHLDLFPDGFKELADPSKGVIPVSWDVVPCGITSPIVLKNKEGTSKFWFSMQVMNSNVAVEKLEVSTDGGATWQSTTRKEYNFFEQASGFGTESVDVKVTSVDGTSVVVKDVSVTASSTMTASGNFS